MDCPTCDGTGEVDDPREPTGVGPAGPLACRDCGGTGKVRTPKGLKKLRKDLGRRKTTVPFNDGAVIRWVFKGQYSYVAVLAAGKWWVSGRVSYVFSHDGVAYDTLVGYLSRPDVTDIEVATTWAPVA